MIKLQEQEKIRHIYRRHWLLFASTTIQIIFTAFVVFAGVITVNIFFEDFFSTYFEFILLAMTLILELLWVVIFVASVDHYLDSWVITNQRIIFVELKGLFSRSVESVSLRNIQDVSTEVHGVIPTLLKYGNVDVQSAGTEGHFTLKQVPKPYEIKNAILEERKYFIEKGQKK